MRAREHARKLLRKMLNAQEKLNAYKEVLAASRPRLIVSDPKASFLGAECFAVNCERKWIVICLDCVCCVVISCEAEPEQTLNYFEYIMSEREKSVGAAEST